MAELKNPQKPSRYSCHAGCHRVNRVMRLGWICDERAGISEYPDSAVIHPPKKVRWGRGALKYRATPHRAAPAAVSRCIEF
jgi:hypothetical protein